MTAWRSHLVIANLANVPPQGSAKARANGDVIFGMKPDLVALTEAWHSSTMAGIFGAAPEQYRFCRLPNNSAVLAFDSTVWGLVSSRSLILHGAVASKLFGVVSDVRRMPWAVLKHRETGRMVIVGVLHVAPTASKRNRFAQRAARAARWLAFYRLRRFAANRHLPVILAGDWNATGPVLGELLADRRVRLSNPNRIDRVETLDGTGITLSPSLGHVVEIPWTDHDGAVLVRIQAYVRNTP